MSTQVERAAKSLFSDSNTVNAKFFLGSNREVTAEELAEQFLKAEAQVKSGTATLDTHLDKGMKTQSIG